MATRQPADIRSFLGGGASEDRVAAAHFLTGAVFLVVGGLLEVLVLFALRFAGLSPVSMGRLEPMANLTLMIGFLVISLLGGVYYVLPRLTGAPLRSVAMARGGLWLLITVVVAGLGALAFGYGDGQEPFGLPWWLDVPLLLGLTLPALNTLATIARRQETRTYVTLWFVMGGVVWLPLLFAANLIGTLPFESSLTQAYSGLFFTAGFVTMWLFTVGTGLFYYTLVKELDVPLASRQLAGVGFWSLGFAAVWWGVAQLVFGPGPGWVDAVAAALGLAFPIGALANASNVSLTLQGHWDRVTDRPGVSSGVVGTFFGVVVAVIASLASFRSIGSVTALTSFWEAIEYACLLGVGPLLVAGVSLEALPRITGRAMQSTDRARSFRRLTVVGVGGVLVTMAAAGILSGYSWLGGSNSAAYVDAGNGWAAGASAAEPLMLIAFVFSIIAFLGQLAYASAVIGTVTSGRAVPQEVLVYEGADE
ncbi:MAG TPA: cbb3-type cytochrome c oxidase subunit I [Acidimicrobiia bacterium]|nr:cbb3-type cytochrome c oxidase subunit I [Acidimicrobiia bacterium]